MGNFKLTFHKDEGNGQRFGVTENIIDNNICFGVLVDDNAMFACQVLPCTIKVMDEGNECRRAVNRSKRHDLIRPFCGIWASKGKFFL